MLSVAARTAFRGGNLPVVNHLQPCFDPGLSGFRFPVQIVNFVKRPKEIFRVSVAVQAKFHAQRLGVINLLHLVYLPVAFHATYTPVYVYRMIKIDIIRHLVNFYPRNRVARGITFPNGGQGRTVRQYLIVAVHASCRIWDICMARTVNVSVTVAAIQTELADVQIMAVSDRLDGHVTYLGIFGRKVIGDAGGNRRPEQEQGNQQPHRNCVGPFGKYICH